MKKAKLEIVYEDDVIIVVNKPSGVLSVPDRYNPDLPHLASILSHNHGDILIVHRLDKDTSGLMVMARDAKSHSRLNEAFQNGTVEKKYLAIVAGHLLTDSVTVDLPLRPDGDRKHRTVVDRSRGKPSSTTFIELDRFDAYSLVEAAPHTGRTHQIRCHLAAIDCPIVCDTLYGRGKPLYLSSFKHNYRPGKREERPLIDRLALHASSLKFEHPTTGKTTFFQVKEPKDIRATVNQLGKYGRRQVARDSNL